MSKNSGGRAATPAPHSGFVPLAEVTRGGAVESTHFGAVAVVDREGEVLYSAGDPHVSTYTRSACKPFQAMTFIAREGHVHFDFSPAEIAVICASHSGETRHVEAVRSILGKIGRSEDDLKCGTHPPIYYRYTDRLPRQEEVFTPAQENCSGKHAGMLAFCALEKTTFEDYLDFDHPIQRQIKRAVAYYTGVPEGEIETGIDGCSAPNFALPLSGLARAFARLTHPEPDPEYGEAPNTIFDAMTTHPEMVSGEHRNDLAITQTGGGDWVAKVGGEAIQGVGIRSRGWGLAIKIADGNPRALHPATVAVLNQLGLVARPEETRLKPFIHTLIKNFRKIETGVVRPVFRLEQHKQTVAAVRKGN